MNEEWVAREEGEDLGREHSVDDTGESSRKKHEDIPAYIKRLTVDDSWQDENLKL